MLVSHFIENVFWSGLTLVSSKDIIAIKILNKNIKKPQENKQKDFFKKFIQGLQDPFKDKFMNEKSIYKLKSI